MGARDRRPSLDKWALGIAGVVASRATCLRRAVGCVLLDGDGRVLATGYNGVAAGLPHCNKAQDRLVGLEKIGLWYPNACEGAMAPKGSGLDHCEAVHAEQNALLQCHDTGRIHTCAVTVSPCVNCAKLLLGTPCQRVVFLGASPHPEGLELWAKAGRTWQLVASTGGSDGA